MLASDLRCDIVNRMEQLMTTTVSKKSANSSTMEKLSSKIVTLMGGTTAMRAAGDTYLPKNPKEGDQSYKSRLDASWLFNGTRQTVRDMTGYVFDKPVMLDEGVPEKITDWAENIDMQGRDLNSFAKDLFQDGLVSGLSYIFVDAPKRKGGETLADENTGGFRPFMSNLKQTDVLGIKSDVIGGVTVLTQIRIKEVIQENEDEFQTKDVEQIRVIDRESNVVSVRTYRRPENKAKQEEEWILHEGPDVIDGIEEITVVPFYSNRQGFFYAEPILDDLSDVNIAHWQSQSDQRNILHVARVPILFASGIPEGDEITVSAASAHVASAPEADMKWVEHTGKAISSGRQDLKDLEFQMETHGLQLLVQRAGNQSATGEAIDAKKETSQLAMIADGLEDALEVAFGWMMKYGGVEGETNVTVNKEFGAGSMAAHELNALLTMVATSQISKRTFLAEIQRRGLISESVDIEDEIDETGETSDLDMESDVPEQGDNVVDFVTGLSEALNG